MWYGIIGNAKSKIALDAARSCHVADGPFPPGGRGRTEAGQINVQSPVSALAWTRRNEATRQEGAAREAIRFTQTRTQIPSRTSSQKRQHSHSLVPRARMQAHHVFIHARSWQPRLHHSTSNASACSTSPFDASSTSLMASTSANPMACSCAIAPAAGDTAGRIGGGAIGGAAGGGGAAGAGADTGCVEAGMGTGAGGGAGGALAIAAGAVAEAAKATACGFDE